MMSNFLRYIILSCMLYKTVVTQVNVTAVQNGTIATLTCNITSFTLPSSWINDSSSGSLSICPPAGTCSPSTSGRYSYSATSSTIVARISAFDATIDNFGWKCRHNTDTHVYTFTFTTVTRTTISSTTNAPNASSTSSATTFAESSTSSTTALTSDNSSLQIGLGVGLGVGILVVAAIILLGIGIKKGKLPCQKQREPADKKPDIQPEPDDMKGKKNNSGPPAVHMGTQNKVDPNTNSKQTNDRPQPLPPMNTGFEGTPLRPLPATPQNGKIKDRNLRGISATIGDEPDLAGETPRPNRLSPLSPKQATVQNEDASEEPKKKRKKKKKKDQINEETPEEENGKTNLRVN